jgi:hypothetical protein
LSYCIARVQDSNAAKHYGICALQYDKSANPSADPAIQQASPEPQESTDQPNNSSAELFMPSDAPLDCYTALLLFDDQMCFWSE